jgi:hypothetical protein
MSLMVSFLILRMGVTSAGMSFVEIFRDILKLGCGDSYRDDLTRVVRQLDCYRVLIDMGVQDTFVGSEACCHRRHGVYLSRYEEGVGRAVARKRNSLGIMVAHEPDVLDITGRWEIAIVHPAIAHGDLITCHVRRIIIE